MNLTRGERFKDARIVHNQHGKQTMDEVAAATGIKKSLIQALENDDNDRDVGYTKVATLAAHYRVTADFLLGFTNDPHPQRTAIDDLGITPAVASHFIHHKSLDYSDCDIPGKYNDLLEYQSVWILLRLMCDYTTATKVDSFYYELLDQYQGTFIDEAAIVKALLDKSEEHRNTDIDLCDFFQAKAHIVDWDKEDSMLTLGMESFDLAELWSIRITKQLNNTLDCLRRGDKDGID
jgi:transcriptional regulator with XRE-family HTH domain